MKAICFGDSNTYGYDPCSWPGGRYGADSRWVDILAVETGWRVCNMGQNGRTIPETAPAFPADTDLLILMLGTNDLLQGSSPQEAAWKLERFLAGLPLAPSQILLIAPPPLALGGWVSDQRYIGASQAFARCCRALAKKLGVPFADAGGWGVPLAQDGVHFTRQGHEVFAAGLLKALR